jgi:hypothetical protein
MEKEEIVHKIENGKQLGKSILSESNSKKIWLSVGIQKWHGYYMVSIDQIFEHNMASEVFEKEIKCKFLNLLEALEFISKNTGVSTDDLSTLKGQRIFNPEIEW